MFTCEQMCTIAWTIGVPGQGWVTHMGQVVRKLNLCVGREMGGR